MPLQDFAGTIPPHLQEADDLLTRYGRWAVNRPIPGTCGSAEGAYRPPGGQSLQDRRAPAPMGLTVEQRVAAQKALYQVPGVNRVVLAVLYVPNGRSVPHRMRMLGVPPRLAQGRHVDGLQMWWNLYGNALTAAETSGRMRAT